MDEEPLKGSKGNEDEEILKVVVVGKVVKPDSKTPTAVQIKQNNREKNRAHYTESVGKEIANFSLRDRLRLRIKALKNTR